MIYVYDKSACDSKISCKHDIDCTVITLLPALKILILIDVNLYNLDALIGNICKEIHFMKVNILGMNKDEFKIFLVSLPTLKQMLLLVEKVIDKDCRGIRADMI